MKDKFYIFLDIDGTLWDYSFLRREKCFVYKLNPDSINAVNSLINRLEQKFNCELVITSQRRKDWDECKKILIDSGLKYESELKRTKINDSKPRGIKIAEYLDNDKKGREFSKHKTFNPIISTIKARVVARKMSNNYVVIDDCMKPLVGIIPSANIIKTSMSYESFNMKMADEIIDRFVGESVNEESNINGVNENTNISENVNDSSKKTNESIITTEDVAGCDDV